MISRYTAKHNEWRLGIFTIGTISTSFFRYHAQSRRNRLFCIFRLLPQRYRIERVQVNKSQLNGIYYLIFFFNFKILYQSKFSFLSFYLYRVFFLTTCPIIDVVVDSGLYNSFPWQLSPLYNVMLENVRLYCIRIIGFSKLLN